MAKKIWSAAGCCVCLLMATIGIVIMATEAPGYVIGSTPYASDVLDCIFQASASAASNIYYLTGVVMQLAAWLLIGLGGAGFCLFGYLFCACDAAEPEEEPAPVEAPVTDAAEPALPAEAPAADAVQPGETPAAEPVDPAPSSDA